MYSKIIECSNKVKQEIKSAFERLGYCQSGLPNFLDGHSNASFEVRIIINNCIYLL